MTGSSGARIALRTEGVSVLIDVADGQLPSIVHWGADLGEQTEADFAALVEANRAQVANNGVDDTSHLAVLPEHWTGWVGRPGLSGSRLGRDWSTKFTSTEISVDGQVVGGAETSLVLVNAGTAVVEVEATDTAAGLGLRITFELTTGGLLRSRARVTNLGTEDYQVDDLVLAYPVPDHAREILDFAGRWAKERTPQRSILNVGTHLREGRKGRTGADAATVLHVGTPGFGFADGEIWGVHVGWSGNHTHYAERVSTGEQVVGGGELLLSGEVQLSEGASYETPWLYGSYAVGLDAVARRFHRFLRARDRKSVV